MVSSRLRVPSKGSGGTPQAGQAGRGAVENAGSREGHQEDDSDSDSANDDEGGGDGGANGGATFQDGVTGDSSSDIINNNRAVKKK